jgi:glutamate dehydrogenase (NADP+)
VLSDLRGRVPWETEFLQAVEEVLGTISPVLEDNPAYQAEAVLERLIEPRRVISFPVIWEDDRRRVRVNRGWRVQFNNALGPFKGGTRFHPSVSLSSLKFLGFEQTFKNALTGLPLGGGKGGADLQTRGCSERELMRFSQSYMTELFRHIGAHEDVPAGDIGVGTREIGYLFGQYKRIAGTFEAVLTGKARDWGGSWLRPEATGYGVVYFAQELLRHHLDTDIAGKRVAVSGFGNVAWGAVKKAAELGARVVTVSGPDGFVHVPDGIQSEQVDFLLTMRNSGRDEVAPFAERFKVAYHPGKRPWGVPCDLALPCAIQNELDEADARSLLASGCQCVVEGANMPTTPGAARIFAEASLPFAPGKAANAGGVAVSGLEMTQNRMGLHWSPEQVDQELHRIMTGIHTACVTAAERYGRPGDYVSGANIAGFQKVAQAMVEQGQA